VILLDTSALIDALTGPRRSAAFLRAAIERGERIQAPTLVLYEWLRGPRSIQELEAQEALFPRKRAPAFGAREAAIAAELYRSVRRPRGRAIDLAIAACALAYDAELWTLNVEDFDDIPALVVRRPDAS
jgi:predicted nucleic acid-binding protein